MGITKFLQNLFDRDEEWKHIESFPDPPEPVDEPPEAHPMDHFTNQGMEPTMSDDAEDGEEGGEKEL